MNYDPPDLMLKEDETTNLTHAKDHINAVIFTLGCRAPIADHTIKGSKDQLLQYRGMLWACLKILTQMVP